MKKTWVLSLALVVTAIVGFACGGGDEATPTTQPTTTPATATSPAPFGGGSVTLEIGSASSDNLVFDTDALTVSADAEVVLTFSNNATTQQHNWVLVASGTKDDVAVAGLSASSTGWIPVDDDRIIAYTELINAGETGEVQFTAPAAGTYQFVCTFPGHSLTMFGTFEVTP